MEESNIKEIVENLAKIAPDITDLEIKVYYNNTPAQIYKGVVTFDRSFVSSQSEDVIAFVLGHEYAHQMFEDGRVTGEARGRMIEAFFKTLKNNSRGFLGNLTVGLIGGFLNSIPYNHSNRFQEKRADLIGAAISVLAGYSKEEAVSFLKRTGGSNGIFSTHPDGYDRAEVLNSGLDELLESFLEYAKN